MPPHTPVSLGARERLRDHQVAAAKAIAVHSTALGRLSTVISRRAQILVAQDAIVAAASAEVAAAVAGVVRAMGVETAAGVLGLSKAEVRRVAKAGTSGATGN